MVQICMHFTSDDWLGGGGERRRRNGVQIAKGSYVGHEPDEKLLPYSADSKSDYRRNFDMGKHSTSLTIWSFNLLGLTNCAVHEWKTNVLKRRRQRRFFFFKRRTSSNRYTIFQFNSRYQQFTKLLLNGVELVAQWRYSFFIFFKSLGLTFEWISSDGPDAPHPRSWRLIDDCGRTFSSDRRNWPIRVAR